MAGNKLGGQKAAKTNRERWGDDFYRNIGRKGGQNGHTGGFASNPALAKIAGRKGGRISKRGQGYKTQIKANADIIKKMYVDEKKSVSEISRMVGIPYESVRQYIRKENQFGWF